jgi:hypothetical protein
MGISVPIGENSLPCKALSFLFTEKFQEELQLFPAMLLKKLCIQIENILNLFIEFFIVGFDGAILKISDPLIDAMIWIRRIEFDIPIPLARIAVLLARRISFVPFASSQEIGVIEIFTRVQVLTMPVCDLHWRGAARFARTNAAKAVTAQASLFPYKLFSKSLLIPVTFIAGAGGSPILGQASRFRQLSDLPHRGSSMNFIRERGRITSASSEPTISSS